MFDNDIIAQVKQLLSNLQANFTFDIYYSPDHEKAGEMLEFCNEIAKCSDKLDCRATETKHKELRFSLLKNGKETGVGFQGIPGGHEFSSLLLALHNADNQGKNLPDEATSRRIASLKGDAKIRTFVSLTCSNCPDVVQALNIIALTNKGISHEMVDGAVFDQEAERLKVQSVPAVFVGDTLIHVGRSTLGELLDKLEDVLGTTDSQAVELEPKNFDLIVLGGGPAGASAAIYSARKGLRVAVVAEHVGGQVNETVGIENLISMEYTTGRQLAGNLKAHMNHYPIEIFENRKLKTAQLKEKIKTITTKNGEIFTAPAVIIATGAGWRRLGVEGETEYIGRGVAFCPHCDGPFYEGKHVAVVGGGNSGIEAAIDLAGICSKVTVFEFADTLKADTVLQDKARSLANVEIITSAQTTKIIGDGTKLTALRVKDRKTDIEQDYPLDGVFIQIGLSANSTPFKDQLETTQIDEIKIDEHCRTALPGVYAAGDVSSVPYKQIVIAMGEGAKAALTAFDDRIRGIL